MKNILFNGNVTEKMVNDLAENNVSEFVCACEKRYDDQLEKISQKILTTKYFMIFFMEKLTFFFIPYKYGAKLILNFELSKFMG